MILNTVTFALFATALICTVLTHYLGFSSKDEFLFFNRHYAQALFFLFLFLVIILGYMILIT